LAIGTAIATSRKRKRDIIDDSYHRYSYGKEVLPKWFTEDESKHKKRPLPVTREEVEAYKERMREINARPIMKVIEAKAKKKDKMLRKLEKVRKRAEGVLEASDTSEREKQQQIKGMYKRAGLLKKKREKVTYVVAKKSQAGKNYSRPSGVKGQYKVVDPRLKKDLRAAKLKEKSKKRGKRKN
jgi:AdoMet-dependent rRNA methyltransferase SPB1